MEKVISSVAVALIFAVCAAAEMPSDFYTATSGGGQTDSVFVKNYEIGAAASEVYSDVESLARDTEIRTASYRPESRFEGGGFLSASINSNVIGRAHISWRSVDPQANSKGRHAEWGRSVEDLVGVFTVEKFVLLWSNSTPGEIDTEWMPCV